MVLTAYQQKLLAEIEQLLAARRLKYGTADIETTQPGGPRTAPDPTARQTKRQAVPAGEGETYRFMINFSYRIDDGKRCLMHGVEVAVAATGFAAATHKLKAAALAYAGSGWDVEIHRLRLLNTEMVKPQGFLIQ